MQQDGIYWRNGVAYGRLWVTGTGEVRRSLRTRDPQRARAAFEEFKAEVTGAPVEHPTFKQAVVNWNEVIAQAKPGEGIKGSTRDRYLGSIRMLSAMFADYRLADIDTRAIGEFVKARRKGTLVLEGVKVPATSNATIRRDLTALSQVFRAAVAFGVWHENPVKAWDRGVIPETRAPFYVPTVAEIELVASHASPSFAGLIRFAAYTGCRQGEAVGLTWRDVRLERGEVRFFHTKTTRPRVCALKNPAGDATATLSAQPRRIGQPLVFWHGLGEGFTGAAGLWGKLARQVVAEECAAGRTMAYFSFHKLRHAFAIRWLEQGGDIYALSGHLGHTSVKTTEIYLDYIRKGFGANTEWDEAEKAAEGSSR